MQMLSLSAWPLWVVVGLFVTAAVVIAVGGTRMTRAADRLADLTGIGEALFGAVLLGGATSLPGIITSVATAAQGFAEIAISNAVGGIAAQTTFLAIADITYRRANLEHAAASVENLMQGALLSTLLAFPLLAMNAPPFSLFGIHPMSVLLVCFYVFGINLISEAQSAPLWQPRETYETVHEETHEEQATRRQLRRKWLIFGGLALVVAGAGFAVAQTGIALAERTGLNETIVGGLLTAVVTSLPELVTSIAAVRHGALSLAVGGIIGGNSFDVLFVAFADASFRSGSIYHEVASNQVFVIALTLLLTGILMMGLLRRERTGILSIGFESFLALVLYVGAFVTLFWAG
jgi:cation:H+ antiporter